MTNPVGWPSISFEEHPWRVDRSYGTSKSAARRHRGTYRSAVLGEIAGLDLPLGREAGLAAEEAAQELVRFDAGSHVDGEIAPLAAVLLRTESSSSSQMENLTSGARQVATAALGEPAAHNASLIVGNVRAMEAAIRLSEQLDQAAIITMQQELLGRRSIPGWRYEQVWIGGSSVGPHQADFVPPHHGLVPPAMADLERFMARDDLPVLPQVAVAHAQFETIHPFPDGNGRTGRALLHAMLRRKGLVRRVTVPVSAGLLMDTRAYFGALGAYREGDPDAIVLALADAVFAATTNARALTGDIGATLVQWRERLKARADSVAWRLLPVLPSQPVVNASFVAGRFGVSGVAAQRALAQLESAGILREFTGKRRARLWVAAEMTDLLDGFAARLGRREQA